METNYVQIYQLNSISQQDKERILRRGAGEVEDILPRVQEILDNVQRSGNDAVLKYMKEFDGVDLTVETMKVSTKELKDAYSSIDDELYDSLKTLGGQVQRFHDLQRPTEWFTELSPGFMAGQTVIPLESAGCYAPGGRGWFPTTVFMNACPAKSAGVARVVLCTPPEANGLINPATVVAADIAGVKDIYKLSGAQAIAAMGFGTQTIEESDIIVGPGSAWVVAAKMLLKEMGKSVGAVAGPGECLVLADETANPEWVAADMIIQSEHGNDSSGVLVVNSMELAIQAQQYVNKFIDELPAYRRAFSITSLEKYGAIIVTESLDQGIEFVNEYVAEHLEVATKNPFQTMKKIKNAGAFYLGHYAPMSMGCYCSGANHVLPTAGTGRIRGGLSTEDFLKKVTFEYPSEEGLRHLEKSMTVLADYETFYAHGNAIRKRFPESYSYCEADSMYQRRAESSQA